ncbi:MAG: DUF3788 domain-containing protein [Eggerthella lenta]
MAAWHELFRSRADDGRHRRLYRPSRGRVHRFTTSYGAKPRIGVHAGAAAPGLEREVLARGRALCTVYPRDGFFICMVSVGSKEKDEAEALLATADPYVRALYERSADSSMGRWLMIEVTSEAILRDAEALMMLRAAPKKKARS